MSTALRAHCLALGLAAALMTGCDKSATTASGGGTTTTAPGRGGDTAGSKLAITSPALQLQDSNKQTFAGQIVFTVQSRQTSLPLFAPGHAVAAMASQKLTYKSPTPNQRAQTYLTYVNYNGVNSTIDALYITGDNGYTVTQGIPEGDMTKDDPLVSISFLKCADTACKTPGTATSISAGDWQNSSLSKPLISLLQSLVIE